MSWGWTSAPGLDRSEQDAVGLKQIVAVDASRAPRGGERGVDDCSEGMVFEMPDPLGVALAGEVPKVAPRGVVAERVERHQLVWRRYAACSMKRC